MSDFKTVVGFDRYTINTCGVIMNNRNHKMSTRYDRQGYVYLGLYDGLGKQKFVKVHRLVAEAFIPNPDNKPHVNHINGIKDDNRVENLEWVTQSENMRHADANGLRNLKGTNNGGSKLNESQVLHIRGLYKLGLTPTELSSKFGVSKSLVHQIVNKRIWKHI